jgi:hypothetical protein
MMQCSKDARSQKRLPFCDGHGGTYFDNGRGLTRRIAMSYRCLIGAVALTALSMSTGSAQAADDAKYPDWSGQWNRLNVPGLPGQPSHDPTKPWGPGQQAPLTVEYQKVLEDSMADQAKGGLGNYPTARCLPDGMPEMMAAFGPLEFIITTKTTYILVGRDDHHRRIFTDGREWPKEIMPTYAGYSIGRWVDEDGNGSFDVLEVETRGFKGPRAFDSSGLPLHFDNESIFKERFQLDKTDPNIIRDEITTIDHALTRPWTVVKKYVRNPDARPDWPEYYCGENNAQVVIAKQNYFLSADGLLMPARKDQPPPDLRYFKQTTK